MKLKKYTLFILFSMFSIGYAHAQLGIGTNQPQAQLQIEPSNSGNPKNTDGLLVPRVQTLPNASETGGMVYLLNDDPNTVPVEIRGFYFWDASDSEWHILRDEPEMEVLACGEINVGDAGGTPKLNYVGPSFNLGTTTAGHSYWSDLLFNVQFVTPVLGDYVVQVTCVSNRNQNNNDAQVSVMSAGHTPTDFSIGVRGEGLNIENVSVDVFVYRVK